MCSLFLPVLLFFEKKFGWQLNNLNESKGNDSLSFYSQEIKQTNLWTIPQISFGYIWYMGMGMDNKNKYFLFFIYLCEFDNPNLQIFFIKQIDSKPIRLVFIQ